MFAREGARVVCADLNGPGAETTAAEIKQAGGDAVAVQANIASEADLGEDGPDRGRHLRPARRPPQSRRHLHPKDGPITELSAEAIDETFNTNCKGMLFTVKYAARQMIKQGGGAIVNTCSDLAYIGLANLTAYTASKSAVVGVTRTLAVELAPHGIRVNAVSPGFTFSGMNVALQGDKAFMDQMRLDYLIPSLGQPEDVAYAVLHLASDKARFTTGASLVTHDQMRVAVLGLTDDPIWSNLRNLANVAGAEIVAAAEPDAKLRERFASEHGKNWSEKKQKSEG